MEWLRVNEEGEVEFVSEEIKLVPEVQALLVLGYNKGPKDADGRKRYRAKNELKYLYLAYSMRSPYRDYSESERLAEARMDCGFASDWKESKELKEAIAKYLRSVPKVVNTLRRVHKFLDKFEEHLDGINLNERNENNSLVHDPKKIMETINALPKLVETLQELENQAKSGVIVKSHSRGDHETGWMSGKQEVQKTKRNEEENES